MGNRTYCAGCQQEVTDIFCCPCKQKGFYCLIACGIFCLGGALCLTSDYTIIGYILIALAIFFGLGAYGFCNPKQGEIMRETQSGIEVRYVEKKY